MTESEPVYFAANGRFIMENSAGSEVKRAI